MLDKHFDPAAVEARQTERWRAAKVGACHPEGNGVPFTIAMPPPNVTGSLHIGHALNHTLQDVLVRYWRLRGRDALWQPGTDHAGIATQMVVERQLAAEGTTRQALGRDAFVARVWRWKAESGGTIVGQLARLGTSPDWDRERFTMDEGLSAAVLRVFVQLYREGLIYKDTRLVNWDPKLQTAISDLEVESKDVDGSLWHLRYPLADAPDRHLVVATTRPETMLGDVAVAVYPDDERYRDLIGHDVLLPLTGRRIPVIADPHADPETGSGAVKITPAHDFNDYEVGRRHSLTPLVIMDRQGRICAPAPDAYVGLDRFEARKRIVADLEAANLLETIEPHRHAVPHGDRSGVPIEPLLTEQWYCDAATLAGPALEAVEDGRTVFIPRTWEKTYFEWLRNIQPWCISRQLWWGHRIPAWYGPDGTVFVAETDDEARAQAAAHYGGPRDLTRDPDVLDTWFSSALWPFSTLGWPEDTPELRRYYPTDTLVTAFDIIFFWVARMMMMGLHVMGEVPFRTVYIHALVRDAKGQKMSKSKGNIADPVELIGRFGADALRMTLSAMAAQGRDIKLSDQRIEGYRNFATKLWNASRFAEMNDCRLDPAFDPAAARTDLVRWILAEARAMLAETAASIETYRFDAAAGAVYRFTWNVFCDWFLEFAKPIFAGTDAAAAAETRAATAYVLDVIRRALHPFMPFLTEALHESQSGTGDLLALGRWPEVPEIPGAAASQAELGWVVALVSSVRSLRADLRVPPASQPELLLRDASPATLARLARHRDLILRLARVARAGSLEGPAPAGCAQAVLGEATLLLPLADLIDLPAEIARLEKEIAKGAAEAERLAAKLANAEFVARAPEEVVEDQRDRLEEVHAAGAKLAAALAALRHGVPATEAPQA